MIKVSRIGEPEVLTENKAKWLESYLELTRLWREDLTNKDKKKKAKDAESKYNQPTIKSSLKQMFHNKCAYCESVIAHISYGNIEHFKPKSRFPELCFDWDNLLLGCDICNGKGFKGAQFPSEAEGGPLINPIEDVPEKHFRFEYDEITGTANVIGLNSRGETTEKILGLNRPDLVKHRSRIVRRMMIIFINAKKGETQAVAEVEKLIQSDEEYSAFAKALYSSFGMKKH